MNIKNLNEELNKVLNEISDGLADYASNRAERRPLTSDQVAADIEKETEYAAMKAKKRIFDRAIDGLEELQEFIGAGTNPVDGKLDDDTTEFYVKLSDIIEEIHSRSLAFEV